MVLTHRDAGTADFYLSYGNGEKIPFKVVRGEDGSLRYRSGTAPMLAPQYQTEGFSYQQTPAEIDVPVPFEDFSGGCGFTEDAGDTNRYNYTQGVDLSWPGRAYLSPARQTMSGLSTAPVVFLDSTDGFFVAAGTTIYEWSAATQAWTLRDTHTAAYTDLVEFNGGNFAAAGDAAAYKHSADGVTWTASTLGDPNAHRFAVRGQASNLAIIFKISSTGIVKTNTDGTNGGAVAWSAGTPLGHSSETVNSFVEADDKLFAYKVEGFYSFDGTTTEDVWTGGRQMKRSGNGKSAFTWANGKTYTPYGDRILEYDPLGDTAYRWVFPLDSMLGNTELNGEITAITGDGDWLYFALKNRAGNTYICKLKPFTGGPVAHTYAYLGANDCNSMAVAGPGTVHSTNPALVFGYGAASNYIILPRSGLRPEDDTAYQFDTTEGVAYGSWIDVGARTYDKFLNGGLAIAENCTAGMPITVKYQLDGDTQTTAVTLISVASSGETSATLTSDVSFTRVRYVFTMSTADPLSSPRSIGFVFNTTLNPPRRRMWEMDVVLGNDQVQRGGGSLNISSDVQEDFLFAALTKRCTLYDRRGRSFVVRLLDIGGLAVRPRNMTDTDYTTLTLVEISESTQSGEYFILDVDELDGPRLLGVA